MYFFSVFLTWIVDGHLNVSVSIISMQLCLHIFKGTSKVVQ